MRDEKQIRERIERLIREGEIIRQQCARFLLSDKPEDWVTARDSMVRMRDTEATIRALDWVLGNRS